MKNREHQRANHKLKQELLHRRNSYGKLDLTPYEAVKKLAYSNNKPKCPGIPA